MAPADKNTSVSLREVERDLEDERLWERTAVDFDDESGGDAETYRRGEVTVYGPTVRLWPGERPSDRGWSFDVRPDLEAPAFQRRLDEATPDGDEHAPGEFVNVDVQFSYAQLRLDGRRRIDMRLETSEWAQMARWNATSPSGSISSRRNSVDR